LQVLYVRYPADLSIQTVGMRNNAQNGLFVLESLFGERREPRLATGVLVRFHEDVDGFLAALGADLQVVPVVRKRLFAPLAPFDTRGLHLRNFFEQ